MSTHAASTSGEFEEAEKEWVSANTEYAEEALRACTRCGVCMAACVSARALGPRYSPPRRIEAAHRVLARGEADEETLRLLYTCTMCGACTVLCPFGIEVWRLVHAARLAAARRGKQPGSLAAVARNAARGGHSFTPNPAKPRRTLSEAAARAGVRPGEPGDALYVPSPFETTLYPDVLEASLRLLRASGVEVTVSPRVLDLGGNAAIDAARPAAGLALLARAAEEAEKLGARIIVLSGCGADHKLAALAPRLAPGAPRARTVSLYALAAPRAEPRGAVLFPSCSLARFERHYLPALLRGPLSRTTRDKPPYTVCCGGGGGLTYIREAPLAALRDRIITHRARELAADARDTTLVTACIKCYTAIRQGALKARLRLRVVHASKLLANQGQRRRSPRGQAHAP